MTGKNQNEVIQEDLLSTALRYVLEELPPHERVEFECRLVEQQTAREAVAEAVALCQSAKQVIDAVIQDAVIQDAVIQDAVLHKVESAARHEGVWRAPATWAAMAVAASLVAAVVLTGIRGNQFGHKPLVARSADMPSVNARATAVEGLSSEHSDHGKQLAVAWLNFLPSPNETPNETPNEAAIETALVADNLDTEADDAEGELLGADEDSDITDGEEDIIARVDSGTAANDWVFQAVTAEPAATATANPQEG